MAASSAPNDSGSPTIRAVVSLIVLLFGLFLGMLGWSIFTEYSDTQRRAEDRALAGAQVVSTNARWITELSRQALARIDVALGHVLEDKATETGVLIRDAVAKLPGNVKAYVVAANGRTLFSTDPNVKPIDIRDREYFSALAKGADFYTSALLVSRLDGAQIFVFSKRIERGGEFAGAAIISFDVILLRDIWESLGLDGHSTVSLIREDGQLVARYPLAPGPIDLSNYVLFTEYLTRNDEGSYFAHSPADGVDRIVAYRRVPGTQFVALASISSESVFGLFWRNTFATLGFALPLALALVGAIFWILHLLRKDAAQRQQLVEALSLNQMLVKDTHHRVKNNLQAIMSMVRMHELPIAMTSDLQARISAMSAVHEHLYRLDNLSEIDARSLIPGIVEPLRQSFDGGTSVEYDIDNLVIDRDHATPLALLISEVVTNALKYAHSPGKPGHIKISLKSESGREILLTIADNGQGFDPSDSYQGLGSRLIRAMLQQLNATSSYSFEGGTRFQARASLA